MLETTLEASEPIRWTFPDIADDRIPLAQRVREAGGRRTVQTFAAMRRGAPA